MIARLSLLWLAGCSEYTVTLSQTGVTPVPVIIGSNVEMPAGILATAVPTVERNGEEIDTRVEFESLDVGVVAVEPVDSDVEDEWAILAVAPGVADITAIVKDHHEVVINVLVTDQ
jgi:hypothetical protein